METLVSYWIILNQGTSRGEMVNQDNKIKDSILERIILIITMSVYAIFGLYYIPYILILFPAPFIVFGVKNGIITNITNIIVTSLLIGIFGSAGHGLFLLMVFLPIILTMQYLIQSRKSNMEILGISSLVFFISILIILSMANAGGIEYINELEGNIQQILLTQLEKYQEMDLTSYQFLEIQERLEVEFRQSLLIIPSVLMVISLLVSYLNYLVVTIGLDRVGIKIVGKPKFSKFKLPNNIIVGLIIMFSSVFIMDKMDYLYTETVSLNLTTLAGFMFLIQGLSVVDHFFIKIKLLPLVRFIIYIMFIFNQSIIMGLIIIGFIDVIFDLRKIRKSRPQ